MRCDLWWVDGLVSPPCCALPKPRSKTKRTFKKSGRQSTAPPSATGTNSTSSASFSPSSSSHPTWPTLPQPPSEGSAPAPAARLLAVVGGAGPSWNVKPVALCV